MACPAQVFVSITREQFDMIVAKAAAAGINLTGAMSGEASHADFTVQWHFDAAAATFTVQCTRRPFLATCGMINDRIRELVLSSTRIGGRRTSM